MHTICDTCDLYQQMIDLLTINGDHLALQSELLIELARWQALSAMSICLLFGVQLWRIITIAKNQRRFW